MVYAQGSFKQTLKKNQTLNKTINRNYITIKNTVRLVIK